MENQIKLCIKIKSFIGEIDRIRIRYPQHTGCEKLVTT